MIISARPYPNFGKIPSKTRYFNLDEMTFYPLGRIALLSGLTALGLKKGDSIIMPAFICQSFIQPLQSFGFNLVFIDIGKSLELPVTVITNIVEKDDSIKAILVVHYFGLTQNIDEIANVCQKYKIKIVEDASHSFMSQLFRDRGSIKSDIEIFSMRKSLPVLDGGALRINTENYRLKKSFNSRYASILNDINYLIMRFFERLIVAVGVNIYGQFVNRIKVKLRGKLSHEFQEYSTNPHHASWQLKKYLRSEEYLQNTKYKITNNFNQLSQTLQDLGFRLFLKSIKDNIIPQACIVFDDRGGMVDYLRLNGIGAWQWPGEEMPQEVAQNYRQYPNTFLFDEKLVLIPIHQSMSNKKINYITHILSKWIES